MTISTSANKTIALGNGSQTQFTFGFVGVSAAYIAVIYTDASGNETVLSQGAGASQYQIVLNAAAAGSLWGVGGTVTYDPGGTPIATGTTLTIFRTLPLTQAISLQNLVSLSTVGNGAETGLDTIEMQLQQVAEQFGRSIVAPIVDPSTINLTLPAAAQRANLVLGFDGFGNAIATTAPSSGSISSAMQPVVNAASLAAGRTALGLGSMAVEGIGGGLQDDGAGNARVLFAISQVAANVTINAASFLTKYEATGALNFSLPQASTLWSGFGFWVDALTAAQTLIPNAADTIAAQGATSGGNVTIPQGALVFVKTNALSSGTWWIEWASGRSAPVATGGVSNLFIKNDGSAPNTSIDVTFNGAILTDGQGGAIAAPSSSLVISALVNGANGLDVSSLSASTWYYVWTIGSGATIAGLLSLSSSAPTLPAGYIYKKYLGAVRTDSSGHFLRINQANKRAFYKVTTGSNLTTDPQIYSGNNGGAIGLLSLATFVPPTATEVSGMLQVQNGFAGVAPNGSYSTSPLSGGTPPLVVQLSSGIQVSIPFTLPIESYQIGYFSTVTTAALYCSGWTDGLT